MKTEKRSMSPLSEKLNMMNVILDKSSQHSIKKRLPNSNSFIRN